MKASSLLVLVVALMTGACASSPPPAAQSPAPPMASEPPAEPSSEPAPPAYSRFADPMFLTFDAEKNPYSRRTIAKLWVAAAEVEALPERMQAAKEALEQAEAEVGQVADACQAGAVQARDRADSTKTSLEQQFLQAGEGNPTARTLDAQIHVLRDELESLSDLARPCQRAIFEQPPPAE